MQKIIKKITDFITLDYRYSKNFIEQDTLVQKQVLLVHNVVFFLTCVLAGLFFIDFGFLNSTLSLSIIDFFNWDIRFKNEVLEGDLLAFYFGISVFSAVVAACLALYFYCRYGHQQERIDVLRGYIGNEFITTIISIAVSILLAMLFLFGGILFSMIFIKPLLFIPGIEALQILIIAKVQASVATAIAFILQLIFPYGLHPLRFQKTKTH